MNRFSVNRAGGLNLGAFQEESHQVFRRQRPRR
ncbi:hypothetical protein ACV334_37435 [Pseudomonas aeruginosa]